MINRNLRRGFGTSVPFIKAEMAKEAERRGSVLEQ
jgi:hypothetical protein